MKKIELKTRKWLRTLFGCVSLTAVAFVFQACYGTGPDESFDVKLTGMVTSKSTNLPVKGITVTVNEGINYGITDEDGNFDFYASIKPFDYYKDSVHYTPDSVRINFLDTDGVENGFFVDTMIIINPVSQDEAKIFMELEEKQ
ncbi:MAG: carboxypeptidase-like regulatory domain-containing protein [Bacteroidales bacterium]|jgi:hypothetical protein|nr:carboxypeptidase-like regulatory domain-containing protein [Bacteroidales bacterium]